MGAAIAHILGRVCRRGWPDLRVLLAAGAGAGLATAFNAPIAGAVFVLEELVGRFEANIAISALGASAAAIAVARALLGDAPDFDVEPLGYVGVEALPLFVSLGIAAGWRLRFTTRCCWERLPRWIGLATGRWKCERQSSARQSGRSLGSCLSWLAAAMTSPSARWPVAQRSRRSHWHFCFALDLVPFPTPRRHRAASSLRCSSWAHSSACFSASFAASRSLGWRSTLPLLPLLGWQHSLPESFRIRLPALRLSSR